MVNRRDLLSYIAYSGGISTAGSLLTESALGATHSDTFRDHEETSGQRPDRIQRIEPDSDFGFNHPYFLGLPETYREGQIPLLLEMNNADETLSPEEELKRAKGQVRGLRSHGAWLSEELGVPHLKPLFPENPEEDPIEDKHEISLLDRSAMLLNGTDLDRTDWQLLRMAEHARETILKDELADVANSSLHEKFIMYGNSSEGTTAERMAAMHPEKFLAIAGAGLNGIALLPLDELGGRSLNYHVGIADLESIIGKPYDATAHDAVNLFLIQGGADSKNRLMMDKEEALRRNNWKGFEELYETARIAYGPRMVEDRFPRCQIAFEKVDVSAQFRVVPGMPHDDGMAMHEIREFFHRSIKGEDVSEFGQRFRLPLDRTIKLRNSDPGVGDELQFEISGEFPPVEGLVTYEWRVDDGRSRTGRAAGFTIEESGDYDITLEMITEHGQTGQLGMSLLGDGSSFAAFQYATDLPGPRHLADGTEFLVNESVAFGVEVTNVGSVAGSRSLEFVVDGEPLTTEEVQLDPSSSTTVTFDYTFEKQGEVDVRIPPAYMDTMTVRPRSPKFELVDSQLSKSTVVIGQPITVTATVNNGGTGAGEIDLSLMADGDPVAQTSVTLDVDQTETVSIEHTFDEPGEYDLKINEESIGTVLVEQTPTPTRTPTPGSGEPTTSVAESGESTTPVTTTSPGQRGLGVLTALAGIGSALSYYLYRDESEE